MLMIDAIQKRDLPLIQADVFVVAVLVVAINLTVGLTIGAATDASSCAIYCWRWLAAKRS